MNRDTTLLRRIKILTWLFIVGLLISGVTAIPLKWEVDLMVDWFGLTGQTNATASSEISRWLLTVRDSLHDVSAKHPFLFLGTDWLAFGHFVIGLAFVGALRDPVRNRWLFDFGLIACVLVIPYALIFGALRGIPFWWRLIDCSFGVFGFVPLWLCRKWTRHLLASGVSTDCYSGSNLGSVLFLRRRPERDCAERPVATAWQEGFALNLRATSRFTLLRLVVRHSRAPQIRVLPKPHAD